MSRPLNNRQIAPNIQDVGAEYLVSNVIVAGNGESTRLRVQGMTPNMLALQNREIASGTAFTVRDDEERARVVLLGSETAETLFGEDDPVGLVVRLNDQSFEVLGVMEPSGSGTGDSDETVIVPISTAQTRLADARYNGSYMVNLIYAKALDQTDIPPTEDDIYNYFDVTHNIPTPDRRDYELTSQEGLLDSVSQVLGMLTIFLGMIAGISLVVGGIGIMNIMLVTVTERTREIGLRKAVGAEPADILTQFLFESSLLALIGGILGLLVAFLLTQAITQAIADLTLGVQLDAVALATVISSLVGIVFGILPARQAARMNPIDALRYE